MNKSGNKLIDKWNRTGMIPEHADFLRKKFIAEHLEETAKYLVQIANQRIIDQTMLGEILPMIRDKVEKCNYPLNIEETVENLLKCQIPTGTFVYKFDENDIYR